MSSFSATIRRRGATCATRPPSAGTITIAAWRSWPNARGGAGVAGELPRRQSAARRVFRKKTLRAKPQNRLGLRRRAGTWKSCGAAPGPIPPRLCSDPGGHRRHGPADLGLAIVGDLQGRMTARSANGRQHAQAGLLALQLALTAWWRSAGVTPDVVVGPGAGELAAACAAGILTAEEAPAPGRRRRARGGAASPPALQPGCPVAVPFVRRWPSALRSRSWPGPLAIVSPPSAGPWTRPPRHSAASGAWTSAWDWARGRLACRTACSVKPWRLRSRPWALLYAAGVDLTWGPLAPANGRCVRLPAYPWQKQRLWAPQNQWTAPAPAAAGRVQAPSHAGHDVLLGGPT